MPNVELIPTSEAARRLQVHIRTVHRWHATGRLPAVAKGPGTRGPLLFHPADVERLAAELTTEATA